MNKISIKYNGTLENLEKSIDDFKNVMFSSYRFEYDLETIDDIIIPNYNYYKKFTKICFYSFNLINTSIKIGPVCYEFFQDSVLNKNNPQQFYFPKEFIFFLIIIMLILVIFTCIVYIYCYYYNIDVNNYIIKVF